VGLPTGAVVCIEGALVGLPTGASVCIDNEKSTFIKNLSSSTFHRYSDSSPHSNLAFDLIVN